MTEMIGRLAKRPFQGLGAWVGAVREGLTSLQNSWHFGKVAGRRSVQVFRIVLARTVRYGLVWLCTDGLVWFGAICVLCLYQRV